MDNRTRSQDPFFGDPDELNEIWNPENMDHDTSDTASTRTLVAPGLLAASQNPLSIHPAVATWRFPHSPLHETLIPRRPGDYRPQDYSYQNNVWGRDFDNPPPAYFETIPAATSGHVQDGQVVPLASPFRTSHTDDWTDLRSARPVQREATQDEFPTIIPSARDDYMTDSEIRQFTESTGRTSPFHFRSCSPDAPEPSVPTYTLAPDKAMLNTVMSFIDFLGAPERPGMLVVITEDDDSLVVNGLDLDRLEDQCPLLAMGFERNRAGLYKNSLEAKSRILAVSFLRFLCTGSYMVKADDDVALIPPSLLFHAQIYQMADNYDIPALKREAQANITRVTEFACCYPNPPEDLCEATRYIYAELSGHLSLIASIQHYCVNCFRSHNLKDCLPFRQLVDEVPMFGLDLLRTNIERGFTDEGAADIIQLPISTAPRAPQLEADQLEVVDFVYDIWGPRTFENRCGYDSSASSTPSSPRLQGYALVRRPKVRRDTSDSEQSDASASEGEGFTLVHRPRVAKASDVEDTSDWSDAGPDYEDLMGARRRGKLPVSTRSEEPPLSSSVATIRPMAPSQTPTQADAKSESGDLSDSLEAEFTVVKPHDQRAEESDDFDDFEFL